MSLHVDLLHLQRFRKTFKPDCRMLVDKMKTEHYCFTIPKKTAYESDNRSDYRNVNEKILLTQNK